MRFAFLMVSCFALVSISVALPAAAPPKVPPTGGVQPLAVEAKNSLIEKGQFKQILEKIGDENPRVQSAKFESLSAKSAQLSNLLGWTPSVTLSASKSIPEWGLDNGESKIVEAKLNLWKFGGDVSRFREAQKTRRQADLKSDLAILDEESRAAKIMFDWIEIRRRLESQKWLWRSKQELIRVADHRFRLGQLPAQEVEKVRLDASNAEVQIRQAEVEILDLRGQLEAFLPGATEVDEWPWTSVARESRQIRVKNLNDRLDFERLSLEVQIRESHSWQAIEGWLPHIDLTSTWQSGQYDPSGNPGQSGPLGQGNWLSMLTLSMPLWDRGQSLANRGLSVNLKHAAEQDLELYRREESAKLQTLEERREKLRQNLLVAMESNQRSKHLADESMKRFQMGRTSVNDLSIDQGRVFESDSLAQQALKAYHLILLESCLAADERPSRCF